MPWVTQRTSESFQAFLSHLTEFHQKCGKDKYQEGFNAIAEACDQIVTILQQTDVPKDADVMLSTMSSIIRTQLALVTSKKSGSDNLETFFKQLMSVTTELTRFIDAYTADLRLLQNARKGKEEQQRPASALTVLYSEDNLRSIISDLRGSIQKEQGFFNFSIFKRAASHNPLTSTFSILSGVAGLSWLADGVISEYAGPLLNQMLDQVVEKVFSAENTGLNYQDAFGAFFMLMALGTGVGVLIKNRTKTVANLPNDDEIPEEERGLLRNMVINS